MDLQPIYSFLQELKENNNRDWFEENKGRFKELRKTFEDLVQKMIAHLAEKEPGLAGLKAKDCIFRIYRDVRFSHDKTPYKTSFSACIAPGGRKSDKAIRYLHLEPGNTMLAGGIYQPDAARLKKIRQEIDYNATPLKSIIEDENFKKFFDGLRGDQLKRPPKGYDTEHPDIELLKYKSFTVFYQVPNQQVLREDFFEEAMEVYEAMTPFNAYLNEAVAE